MSLRWKLCVGIGAFLLAMSIPITFVILAGRIDATDNKSRCAVVGLVDQLSANSERNTLAAIASPTATKAQKDAARTNLARINELKRTTRETLGHPVGPQCPEEP